MGKARQRIGFHEPKRVVVAIKNIYESGHDMLLAAIMATEYEVTLEDNRLSLVFELPGSEDGVPDLKPEDLELNLKFEDEDGEPLTYRTGPDPDDGELN